jgi:uncharacterized surface protein with fasciclin (FAS1) repeats
LLEPQLLARREPTFQALIRNQNIKRNPGSGNLFSCCSPYIGCSARKNNHQKRKEEVKNLFFMLLLAVAAVAVAPEKVSAQDNPMVGGAAMMRSMDIVDNAMNSADHTTLVAAVKAAGLVNTLKSKGPFTVFAPTNEAFEKLPAGTVNNLLKPENKSTLTKILTYHVLAGNFDSNAIAKRIKAGGGKAVFKTVSGGSLWAWMDGSKLVLRDEKGGMSTVTIANVNQSNGVIHVVDTVLLPN